MENEFSANALFFEMQLRTQNRNALLLGLLEVRSAPVPEFIAICRTSANFAPNFLRPKLIFQRPGLDRAVLLLSKENLHLWWRIGWVLHSIKETSVLGPRSGSRTEVIVDDNHLSHSTWDCKYHLVFTSKYRMKRLYGELRRELVEQFRKLCLQKGCQIVEGHMMIDHVHILISIPPKYSVSHIVGFLKGKTALYVANKYARKRKYRGYHFWARGYFVSTTGYNEQVVRRYIRDQEKADKASDHNDLFKLNP